MYPNFKPLHTYDFETQWLLGAFAAAAETEIGCYGGKKQERKQRLIELGNDEEDKDVELIPLPTQPTQPRKQPSFRWGHVSNSKKPMIYFPNF